MPVKESRSPLGIDRHGGEPFAKRKRVLPVEEHDAVVKALPCEGGEVTQASKVFVAHRLGGFDLDTDHATICRLEDGVDLDLITRSEMRELRACLRPAQLPRELREALDLVDREVPDLPTIWCRTCSRVADEVDSTPRAAS